MSWTRKHSKCLGCGMKEKAHRGQGYCTTCYPKAIADGRITKKKRHVLRRRRRGVTEYRCTECELWKGEDDFNFRDNGQPYGLCKDCRRRHQRKYERTPRARKLRRERQRRVREREAELAEAPEPTIAGLTENGRVPAALVRPVVDQLALNIPDDAPRQQTLADMCRVSTRLIYDVERGLRNVSVETAEKILHAAGMSLEDILGEPGVEGWSKHSRYCLRCGTTKRLHRARGYCTRCYTSALKEIRKYGAARPPQEERWSFKHDSCRRCHTTERKHSRRGLCHKCVSRYERMAKSLGVSSMDYLDALGYTRDFETGAALRV